MCTVRWRPVPDLSPAEAQDGLIEFNNLTFEVAIRKKRQRGRSSLIAMLDGRIIAHARGMHGCKAHAESFVRCRSFDL
jgi:hypothetical protein